MNNNYYFGKESCHTNAKHGEIYKIAICEVCGTKYEKNIEEKKDGEQNDK